MTVFMSPRTSYRLGRYTSHSVFSLVTSLCVLMIGGSLVLKPLSPSSLSLFGLTGCALMSKKGRGAVKRTVKESFYGTLGSFTGTCSTDGNGYIGGGGGHVEGD